MKTFNIMSENGIIAVQQFATFTYYINNVQFRFVVTAATNRSDSFTVTHRHSTKKLTEYSAFELIAACHDHKVAGKSAIIKLINRVGADRVFSVLSAAEK